MKIFGIAGFKNSGKTLLMTEVIRELCKRGLRVATFKHAHHDFDVDHPGKDSFLHREAGATEVFVSSRRRWAHMTELSGRDEPTLDELLRHVGDVDIVLVEGYKSAGHPMIELRRAGFEHPQLAGKEPQFVAIVSDEEINNAQVPVLARRDVAAIADFILANAGEVRS